MGQSTIDSDYKNELAIVSQKYSNTSGSYNYVLNTISMSHNTEILCCKFYNKPSHLVRLRNGQKVFAKLFRAYKGLFNNTGKRPKTW